MTSGSIRALLVGWRIILRRDGSIDFGDSPDRWRTDLRGTEFRVGTLFTVWFNETDQGTYRIVKLAELGAKERK